LSRLICNPALREESGQNARRRLENCFSWHAVGGQYVELYENVARVGKAKPTYGGESPCNNFPASSGNGSRDSSSPTVRKIQGFSFRKP
jgi:hypothetical protein